MSTQTSARTYNVLVTPNSVEGAFTATVPLLPGIVAQGDTVAEALELVRGAIELYIEDLEDAGEDVPTEAAPPELHTVTL